MFCFFFFKQKTAYEMRISDWSSDVCSSDLGRQFGADVERRVVGDAEFDELRLGLDFGLAISAALRLGDVLRLGRAGPELNGHIAVTIGRASCRERVCQYV